MQTHLPTVAIIGRPNVGKSTLWNALLGERRAIVSPTPGTTRDSLVTKLEGEVFNFLLVDTAGLTSDTGESLEKEIQAQAELAGRNADVLVFLVDGKAELTQDDFEIVEKLRRARKPVIFAMNKLDDGTIRNWEAMKLGLGEPHILSAKNFLGTDDLIDAIEKHLEKLKFLPAAPEPPTEKIRLAIVGRPNVGKSSLFNKLLGKAVSVVSGIAGTTRDTLDTEVKFENENPIVLIDTAGLRRPGKTARKPGTKDDQRDLEFWSRVRSTDAIERADVCAVLIDALDGVTHQDAAIAGKILEAGKSIIFCVNKFDLAIEKSRAREETDERELDEVPMWDEDVDKIRTKYHDYLMQKVKFLPPCPVLFFSAKTGRGLKDFWGTVRELAAERKKRIPTADLNRILPEIVYGHVMPAIGTKRGKIKLVSQVASAPPKFLFHVNNARAFHLSYRRYIENQLRDRYGFFGTPMTIEMRDAMNDFKGRRKK
ncbi:ribosome biogenesis GTPase Der [bacterium]|jgi:GTPase|nr:ribosome biogenesis GTPase Der [bacterium]MBT6831699.1 ribosome biogenesis GTPase Der [bacterium]MBT6996679.1 ribosome biogenesis GTPase Der [bacterium]MBT7772848.1 ribosome biogenesis GTPase Der [bacterium]